MLSRQLEFRIFKGFWIELEDKSSFWSLVKYFNCFVYLHATWFVQILAKIKSILKPVYQAWMAQQSLFCLFWILLTEQMVQILI